jgi:hypothetical protein
MRNIHGIVCLAALACAASLFAADSPFAGTWKLNQAKSKFTGTITKYEQKPSGAFTYSSGSVQYEFKIDGKEGPGPFGYTVIWKKVNDSTWETVTKLKGNVISTERIELSKDGRNMTVTSTGKKPNGESFKEVAVLQRTAGGPGLAGAWKSAKFNITAPDIMEIKASGSNGLEVSWPAWKAGYTAQFDGKDYPATGPTVSAGFTIALKPAGPRTLEVVEKHGGKPISIGTMKVSPDGKTLTMESWPPNMKQETTVAVYEK